MLVLYFDPFFCLIYIYEREFIIRNLKLEINLLVVNLLDERLCKLWNKLSVNNYFDRSCKI